MPPIGEQLHFLPAFTHQAQRVIMVDIDVLPPTEVNFNLSEQNNISNSNNQTNSQYLADAQSQICVHPQRSHLLAHQSSTSINLDEIPISVISTKCRQTLSLLLNPTKILLSEEGLPRDWRGLAHFSGLSSQYGTTHLSNLRDPTGELLKILCSNDQKVVDSENTITSLGQFQRVLGIIDRWDVLDDTHDAFLEDAKIYLRNKSKREYASSMSVSSSISSTPTLTLNEGNNSFNPDANILTIDDVALAQQGLPPQKYDAFVLFADEDIDFAVKIVEKMEDYGLKLCVKERDLVGGISFEHEAILRLISDRCTRLIVVISPAFFQSAANTFFVNFAQALGIEQRKRKIIPCQYEYCTVPPTLSYFFFLNYKRSGKLYNFWEKLKDSIKSSPIELGAMINAAAHQSSSPTTPTTTIVPRITITEIDSPSISTTSSILLPITPTSSNSTTIIPINKQRITTGTAIVIATSTPSPVSKTTDIDTDNEKPIIIPRKRNLIKKSMSQSIPIISDRTKSNEINNTNDYSNNNLVNNSNLDVPQIVITMNDEKNQRKYMQQYKQENLDKMYVDNSKSSEKRIWPPQPKLRPSSMWNLNLINNSPTDSQDDISKSTISLNTIPSVNNPAKKTKKWYKKLLSPASTTSKLSSTPPTTNESDSDISFKLKLADDMELCNKKKKKWFRKKIASLS